MRAVNKNEDLTQLSVRQLRTRRRRLATGLPDVEALLRGSLVDQLRRCGKEGCKCTRGELHGPYAYLATGRRRGRSRLLSSKAASTRAGWSAAGWTRPPGSMPPWT